VSQKPIRSDPAKNENEFGNFSRLLDTILRVPHSKIKAELETERKKKPTQKRRASVGHAYRDND